jgi:hypothetical protein
VATLPFRVVRRLPHIAQETHAPSRQGQSQSTRWTTKATKVLSLPGSPCICDVSSDWVSAPPALTSVVGLRSRMDEAEVQPRDFESQKYLLCLYSRLPFPQFAQQIYYSSFALDRNDVALRNLWPLR